MKRDLATIDAMGLILENIEVVLKCITMGDANAGDIQTLAYIADEYLTQLREAISRIPACRFTPTSHDKPA
ncbi:MAG: hypothetical protein FWE40_01290 [Oscillospiraceae bacterium]|nr:hypothetical protein [Oscillospiraceae bacterium]